MKSKQPLAIAEAAAAALVAEFASLCDRIDIAGSVRRRKPEVGDLELVAIPVAVTDLFGEPTGRMLIDDWLADSRITPTKNGAKYKQFEWRGYQVDLFLATPANYGLILMLRTGDADFSRRMVTLTTWGGLLPAGLRVDGGQVWRGGVAVPVPDEATLFALWNMPYISPEQRTAQIVRLTPPEEPKRRAVTA